MRVRYRKSPRWHLPTVHLQRRSRTRGASGLQL